MRTYSRKAIMTNDKAVNTIAIVAILGPSVSVPGGVLYVHGGELMTVIDSQNTLLWDP